MRDIKDIILGLSVGEEYEWENKNGVCVSVIKFAEDGYEGAMEPEGVTRIYSFTEIDELISFLESWPEGA